MIEVTSPIGRFTGRRPDAAPTGSGYRRRDGMVDGDDERDDDRGDRILVRPYVLPDDPDEDVEQTASIPSRDITPLTIDGDVPTEILPTTGRAPAPPPDANDRTMVLWLVGAGLAVVVAAAVVMIALWPRNDSG